MTKEQKLSDKTLDAIIDDMTSVVENSKDEIFQIGEESIKEQNRLKKELAEIKIKVKEYIKRGDQLEIEVQKSRRKLSLVSSQFDRFTERDVREVYEKTHKLQTQLAILRQEEKAKRERRDELERRIKRLKNTIEHAGNLGQKVSVILTYLYDDFSQVNELLKSAKAKQDFGLKIIEVQELERKRLSREIHDGPAQMLANILIRSEIIDLSFREGDVEDALKEIKSIRQNIRTSLQEVRRIIYDLRPMALDDLGLIPTIKKHIATMSELHDIVIEFKLLGDEKRLEPNYEVAIFRLVQEALQNAIKHAEARTINIIMEILSDKITVAIRDDGIGFDKTKRDSDSFGLVGMRERVEILKGTLVIDSKIQKGTTVKFVIPYEIEQ